MSQSRVNRGNPSLHSSAALLQGGGGGGGGAAGRTQRTASGGGSGQWSSPGPGRPPAGAALKPQTGGSNYPVSPNPNAPAFVAASPSPWSQHSDHRSCRRAWAECWWACAHIGVWAMLVCDLHAGRLHLAVVAAAAAVAMPSRPPSAAARRATRLLGRFLVGAAQMRLLQANISTTAKRILPTGRNTRGTLQTEGAATMAAVCCAADPPPTPSTGRSTTASRPPTRCRLPPLPAATPAPH